ncbi:YtxH domain-containing protein [Flavobacterium aquicola]|uniref:Gas vesicle protein n=1 Tax=Flavobacterium aquicola TaxID=1682742 RepID=A0A3E0ETV9_9FLAO|nr:YtxH domain-containing protein [Flavobacterium aquicola]REH00840.1 gas vesicle protein [Flavobacterium aquicola]
MSTGKAVLGTVAGLAIGGILGILFAPEKGSVTRRQIADKGNDCVNDLKSKYEGFANTLKEKIQATKQEAKDIAEIGLDKFDKVQGEFNDEAKNF